MEGVVGEQAGDGTVHPHTAYTLSFLKRLFTYESSISVLFLESPSQPTPLACAPQPASPPAHHACTSQCADHAARSTPTKGILPPLPSLESRQGSSCETQALVDHNPNINRPPPAPPRAF